MFETTSTLPEVTLYYKDGASDKVYQAAIAQEGDGFLVNFAYGRRGSTLKAGTKTKAPVPFAKAQAIFDKLVSSKTSKGYTPGEAGTPYSASDREATGYVPQLLNMISRDEAEALRDDPNFLMQEKFDGERMILIRKDGQPAKAANKKGLGKSLSQAIADSAELLPDCTLDGEAIGDTFHVFDILELAGEDLRPRPTRERLARLREVLLTLPHGPIKLVHTEFINKRELFNTIEAEGGEGVVFKRIDSPYVPGRPASGGNMLKFKFYATATCRVRSLNETRSVSIEMVEDGKWISVGNVTIPPNKSVPCVGDFIEVRYLYAYRGGSLYQPVFLGKRDDVDAEDCNIAQLKYKPA